MLWQTQQIDNVKLSLIFLLLLVVPVVFASCSGNQIDINSASLEDLDKIIWIGPATAQKIVDARPFENVEGLDSVSGIGEVKLADIKSQGLACVEGGDIYDEEEEVVQEEKIVELVSADIPSNDVQENVEAPVIKLNAQTIKSENAEKVLDKGKYSLYGFVGFCVLLVVLFIIKSRKNKDEFRD